MMVSQKEMNEILNQQFIWIVDNQINENHPPETKETYQRLQKLGFSEGDSKKLIAQCVGYEMFEIMKNKNIFNEKRFIKNLKNLPTEP